MCNTWLGRFPHRSERPGGRTGTVPVTAYEPNGQGLHNTSGNVWEWCADAFGPGERVIRGGSYLCHASYCNRYRVAARSHNTPDSSTGHGGFRRARDLKPLDPAEGRNTA
ncbi:SUMF1/EgtB/PvdO family nonheme iron enzyme [Streptomyces baarnensis]